MDDLISRQAVKELAHNQVREKYCGMAFKKQRDFYIKLADSIIDLLPTIQPEIVRCKDCKWWRQQTNYQGAPLSFGFCESDDMWRSLYGETNEVAHIDTDDDFYCGYAERREVTT